MEKRKDENYYYVFNDVFLNLNTFSSQFGGFFFENNTILGTISLVNKFSKHISKPTSWVCWTRVYCNNSSLRNLGLMEIESYTLDFLSFLSPKNKPTRQKTNLDQIKPQEAKNKPTRQKKKTRPKWNPKNKPTWQKKKEKRSPTRPKSKINPGTNPQRLSQLSTPTLSMSRFPRPSSLPPLLLWFVTWLASLFLFFRRFCSCLLW